MKKVLCPYCGKLMDPVDYDLFGGHRECKDEIENQIEWDRMEEKGEDDERNVELPETNSNGCDSQRSETDTG